MHQNNEVSKIPEPPQGWITVTEVEDDEGGVLRQTALFGQTVALGRF